MYAFGAWTVLNTTACIDPVPPAGQRKWNKVMRVIRTKGLAWRESSGTGQEGTSSTRWRVSNRRSSWLCRGALASLSPCLRKVRVGGLQSRPLLNCHEDKQSRVEE